MTIAIPSPAALPEAARTFAGLLGERNVVAFHAPMGAGKTTFISALCAHLGADPLEVNSPTFAIVNDYATPSGSIYHFDLYRLRDAGEALDIGLIDYFDSGHLCLIEWPEVAADLLPADTLHVTIAVDPDSGLRTLTIPSPA